MLGLGGGEQAAGWHCLLGGIGAPERGAGDGDDELVAPVTSTAAVTAAVRASEAGPLAAHPSTEASASSTAACVAAAAATRRRGVHARASSRAVPPHASAPASPPREIIGPRSAGPKPRPRRATVGSVTWPRAIANSVANSMVAHTP